VEGDFSLPSNGLVVVVDGKEAAIVPDMARNLRKTVLGALLDYDALGLGSHPFLSDEFGSASCPSKASSDAITAMNWVKERGRAFDEKRAGALRLMERLAKACGNGEGRLQRTSNLYLAKARMAMAARMPDPALAFEQIQNARQNIDQYLNGEARAFGWESYEATRFEELYIELETRALTGSSQLPQDQWFLPENIGREKTIAAIGLAIDRNWALQVGEQGDYAKALSSVTSKISPWYSAAKASGQEREGRAMIHEAFRRYASGQYRSKDTKDLAPLGDVYWNWLLMKDE
jgi:hypothetical protein